jgi:Coenzyme PQQ synthesis protein D (PqqD)
MNKPKTRNENIVLREFDNEVLIYDLIINKAYSLNETSTMIWQLCDGTHSIAEISQILSQQSNQSISEDLIWLALEGFKKENLLEQVEEIEINFNGLSRRQIIKKVGLASMVMLPVISSVVSPTAANAASLAALKASCTSPSQCASGNCTNLGASRCCVPGSKGVSGFNWCCTDTADCNNSCCTGTATNIAPSTACQNGGLGSFVATCA